VVIILSGGYVYARRHGLRGPSRANVDQMTDKASTTLGSAVVASVSAVTEHLGLGRIVTADTPPSPPPAPPPAPRAPKPARPPSALKAVEARPMPGIAFDLAGTTSVSGLVTYDAIVTDGETDAPGIVDTYGPTSEGVVAPEAVEPRLPHELPPDIKSDQLGRIELVVAVDGSVESVKLLGPPRNVKDALFLSVAKAWQFRPALKDGVPVRYRKIIWIASQ
jgi:hypothetical protein